MQYCLERIRHHANLVRIRAIHLQSVINYDVKLPSHVCEHVHIRVEDDADANIIDSLEDALEFIEEAIDDGGKVLVHCHNGVSRSAALVLAFMCFSMGLGVEDALEMLRMDVPAAAPNEGFMSQLRLFATMGCAVLVQ